MKTEKEKQKLIDQLKKMPIVQIACEKTGISRATYYRWRKSDQEFMEASEEALMKGTDLVNEMAESQLISAIRDQNMTAIIFWLKNRHKAYKTRVELSGHVRTVNEILNDEQQSIMKQALKLSNLIPASDSEPDATNPIKNDRTN